MHEFRKELEARLSALTWTEEDARCVRGRLAGEGGAVVKRKLRWSAVLAAILALALAGAALAATNAFGILDRLFPDGEPGEMAQKLAAPVGESYGDGENTFTVKEYLFDGRELHVEWEARTAGDELVLFTASKLSAGTEQELLQHGDLRSLYLNEYAALGGEYGTIWAGYTVGEFAGDAPVEPFTVTMQAYFLRPLAPVFAEDDHELEKTRTGPMILLEHLDGACWLATSAALHEARDSEEEIPEGMNQIEYYASLNYYDIIESFEVSFTIVPDVETIASTRIVGQNVFETDDYRMEFTKAEFNAAGTEILWRVYSKTGLPFDEDWVYDLDYAICVNGKEIPLDRGGGGSPDMKYYECEAWGNPLAELPTIVEITPRAGNLMRGKGTDARIPEGTEFPTMTLTLEPVKLAR